MVPRWNHAKLNLPPFDMAIFGKYKRAVVTRVNIRFIIESRLEEI
jgi:hypothetical protein